MKVHATQEINPENIEKQEKLDKMTNEQIREHLLKAGVKNLKEFGYPKVTTETILTDEVYKEFFKSMLEENLGNGKQIDEVINHLLLEVA